MIPSVNPRWLAERYLNDFKMNLKMPATTYYDKVWNDYTIKIAEPQAYRVKKMAVASIDGDLREQYNKLWHD